MDLTGIKNQNEYYTNHYFTSIFKENAEDTISSWRQRAREDEIMLPWHSFRDTRRQYNLTREQYQHLKNQELSKPFIQEMAGLYLDALGYGNRKSVTAEVADGLSVPVFHEETRSNGAPLVWAFLSVCEEQDDDILRGHIYAASEDDEENGTSIDVINDEILAKLFFAGDEAPRFIILIGINQIALIDRNKWNEKRYLQFMLDDIFSRHEESTFMALTVLLHKESLCPADGACLLDSLDENSHKHSAGVSDALKYALRECIEILGNEVIYDMKTRQGIDLEANPVNAGELTLECLRYMYRFLFMLFIEARPELGYAPMKSQAYVQGYSLEGLRDVCAKVKEESETVSEGYYICDTISELFRMIYEGYPGDLDEYKKATAMESLHDVFTVEALKAHIFDPEYTKLITRAKLRNSAMLRIVDLMSISRPKGSRERKGRISYSALGINQMGAVYEALLSYRGFIAEETLYEVKRAGDDFDELNVGYFIPENQLENYTQEERVRVNKNDPKSALRKYEKGTFIYRLAGREREKSASYYTPEVLTKCLVKYALKELLEGKTAKEILNLTICEPAMGSAAFLNEAINQIAEAYLNKRQEETGEPIAFDKRFEELQKVKMYIADRNVYGVDLNPIAVELAEVSLWLNTIYKGAYVPWFGTQLVCGNSLIGARKQVYSQSALEAGKWYEKAPRRIMPGETRTKKGQHENTKEIYHFLLGDPGMANYTDKVIKGLEPDNIKIINDWRKEFTKKYTEDDIKTLLNLSEIIDKLWAMTVDLRKSVEKATAEPFSVYGHEETGEGAHTTIREKDEIYHKMFRSEHMNNAGPYARLKAAMDYWCALWFWPIDKADLLPSRQIFFMEMYMILQGAVNTSLTNSSGQLKMFDDSGNMTFDENGMMVLHREGQQIAFDFAADYADLGSVNLDDMRERNERFRIANQIAEEQRFHHWELEFADIFEERGGFDLVIGNPPWIKPSWNEQDILAEANPVFAIKKMSASDTKKNRDVVLENMSFYTEYVSEYISDTGIQNFLNAAENYYVLLGMKANLYKCFLPIAMNISRNDGFFAFLHPDGVFDDPQGDGLRKVLYGKLRKHFQFINEKLLFPEVGHPTIFGLNVYSNVETDSFEIIANLFDPITIDYCYEGDIEDKIPGLKDEHNNWNIKGHPDRVITVDNSIQKVFASVFDGNPSKWQSARLPSVHCVQLISALEHFQNGKKIGDLISEGNIFLTQFWNETGQQEDGTIKRETRFVEDYSSFVYSGPHICIANPFFKTPREKCVEKGDYDNIDLLSMSNDYISRTNYVPIPSEDEYRNRIPKTTWGESCCTRYRVAARKMLNLKQERTLNAAIIPPDAAHTNGILSIVSKNNRNIAIIAAFLCSLPCDYFIKAMGKTNLYEDNLGAIPFIEDEYTKAMVLRILLLNCLTSDYQQLWQELWDDVYCNDNFCKRDDRLSNNVFKELKSNWQREYAARNEYLRRELLVEIDVLASLSIGLSLDELVTMYNIQFPVAKAYEEDTWYDRNGRVVFTTNRSFSGVGLSRQEFETIKDWKEGVYSQTYTDSTAPDGPMDKTINYVAPFDRCDRVADYEEVWQTFEERFKA
ncbi:MAG: N-6 DNA methylase [Oribacterium sp.]|nr:N-6 DNA methylase [Oribacterium sp.]MBO6309562.1 N-6 DNA methylase [Oribacterium sp.]